MIYRMWPTFQFVAIEDSIMSGPSSLYEELMTRGDEKDGIVRLPNQISWKGIIRYPVAYCASFHKIAAAQHR